jgi:TRAP-type uncharacterized transport system fused permease subunit
MRAMWRILAAVFLTIVGGVALEAGGLDHLSWPLNIFVDVPIVAAAAVLVIPELEKLIGRPLR